MSAEPRDPAELAQRIADGETVDLAALEASDPDLARGLRKLGVLARSMQTQPSDGMRWGHLQRLESTAHGGFGEVFRAYDPTLDRMVALKLKRDDAQDSFISGRDFVAEARRLARVRHPNVLAVHGASFHDGRAGLWADWIDGETLSARIARVGAFDGRALLPILRDLAGALVAVHQAGLVHGDVKASNVMLDTNDRVILMDFGAGFDSHDGSGTPSAGTPRYLAPEVGSGQPVTTAVDVFAFGVLTHLLATGRHSGPTGIDRSIRPRALRRLIARMHETDASERPSSVELERELQHLIDAPRRRVRLALLASLVAGLVGIALATTIGLHREERQRQAAEATAGFLVGMLAAPAPESQGRDVTVAELLEGAATRATARRDLDSSVRANLLLTVGRSQLALARLRSADETLSQAQALDTAAQPLGDRDALEIGLRLAEAKSRRLDTVGADSVLDRLEADVRWRSDPVAVARITIERAGWWYFQSKYDEAATTLAPVLDAGLAIGRPARVDALIAQSQIAFEQRRLDDTETAAREALVLLADEAETFGRREIELRVILANALTEGGRFAEGEAAYRTLATLAEQTYGRNSSWAVGMWGNVALALVSQGRFAEAAELLRPWIAKSVALDGEEGATTLRLRSTFAAALYQGGDAEAALAEYETLIPMAQRIYGSNGTQTLIDRFNQLEALNYAGRHAQALDHGGALRLTMAEAMGEDHPFTLETIDAIGYALTALGRAGEAEASHRRTLAKKSELIGADNPYTLLSREYLARALIAQGRNAEARAELTQLLAARERVLGSKHAKTEATRALLASLR